MGATRPSDSGKIAPSASPTRTSVAFLLEASSMTIAAGQWRSWSGKRALFERSLPCGFFDLRALRSAAFATAAASCSRALGNQRDQHFARSATGPLVMRPRPLAEVRDGWWRAPCRHRRRKDRSLRPSLLRVRDSRQNASPVASPHRQRGWTGRPSRAVFKLLRSRCSHLRAFDQRT